MSLRVRKLLRLSPRCLAIALIALVIDAALLPPTARCSLRPRPRPSGNDGMYYLLTRSNGRLRITSDQSAEIAGVAHLILWRTPAPHFWAPLRQQWTATLYFTMYDGSTPAPSETAPVGVDIADARGYANGLARSLLAIGGGTAGEPLPRGCIHNAAALMIGLLALAAVPGTARAYVRSRRTAQQLCADCAYSRQGLSRTTPCPECGCIPSN